MAKYLGLLTADARGKVGGIIMSRAQGGTTLKGHRVPRAPRSQAQQVMQARIGAALVAWRALTAPQQASWLVYAATLTFTNSLGSTYTPTALQLWTQAFINAASFGSFPPSTLPLSTSAPQPIGNVLLETSGSTMTVLALDVHGNVYPGAFLVFAGLPVSPSLNATASLPKIYCGGGTTFGSTTINARYLARWGQIPALGLNVPMRVLPVLYEVWISGTPYVANVLNQ